MEERLTYKTDNGYEIRHYWNEKRNPNEPNKEIVAINKLGQLEDVLEKYNLDTAEELDKDLEMSHRIAYEIGQIEEELGVSLVRTFNAYKTLKIGDYIFGKDGNKYRIEIIEKYDDAPFLITFYYAIQIKELERYTSRRYPFALMEYGTEWAISKEELEDEKED